MFTEKEVIYCEIMFDICIMVLCLDFLYNNKLIVLKRQYLNAGF